MYRKTAFTLAALAIAGLAPLAAQDDDATPRTPNQTMKPLARGTEFAAASMAPTATQTAEQMLRAGGNAFDAIVAGQAVLGLVQPHLNGVGSD